AAEKNVRGQRRLREREREDRPEERSAARRRQQRGEDAFEKRAGRAFLMLQLAGSVCLGESWDRHFPDTQKAEGEGEYHHDHRHLEPGVRELLPPTQIGKGGSRRQDQKNREQSQRKPQIQCKNLSAAVPALLDEREQLETDHRQYARHQVED